MEIILQPLLKNNLIELKPLRETDFEALYTVASDPLIWVQHPDKLRHTRDGFKKYFDSGIKSGGAFLICNTAKPATSSAARATTTTTQQKSTSPSAGHF